MDVWDLVAVIDVCQRPLDHGATQVLRMTTITVDISIQSLDFTVLVDSNLPACKEWVTLP